MEAGTTIALVLAAGYGTRLERDLREDKSGKFRHLVGVPKALIPVAGTPLINYWITAFRSVQLEAIYIVCNSLHYCQFKDWAQKNNFPIENIIENGTTTNESRKVSE